MAQGGVSWPRLWQCTTVLLDDVELHHTHKPPNVPATYIVDSSENMYASSQDEYPAPEFTSTSRFNHFPTRNKSAVSHRPLGPFAARISPSELLRSIVRSRVTLPLTRHVLLTRHFHPALVVAISTSMFGHHYFSLMRHAARNHQRWFELAAGPAFLLRPLCSGHSTDLYQDHLLLIHVSSLQSGRWSYAAL